MRHYLAHFINVVFSCVVAGFANMFYRLVVNHDKVNEGYERKQTIPLKLLPAT